MSLSLPSRLNPLRGAELLESLLPFADLYPLHPHLSLCVLWSTALLEDYPAESDETPDSGVRPVARCPRDAAALKDGLEDLVVAMPLERIRRRLKELDVNPDRGSLLCSEKVT